MRKLWQRWQTFWQLYRRRVVLWFFIISAILFITASVVSLLIPPTVPSTPQENSWQGITPGVSTRYELEQKLGPPIATRPTATGTEVAYSSKYPAFPHIVSLNKAGKILFIKEVALAAQAETLDKTISALGQPSLELFYNEPSSLLKAYVFLDRGILILARPHDGIIEERWYFEPTTRDTFLEQWAADLSFEQPEPERFTIE